MEKSQIGLMSRKFIKPNVLLGTKPYCYFLVILMEGATKLIILNSSI